MNPLPRFFVHSIAGFLLAGPAFEARGDWLSETNARIEQIRKRDWTVQVNDAAGAPVGGATVQVRQRRHAFAFGCALNSYALISEPRYAEFFARNFEWAVFENETKWTDNEPVQGQLAYLNTGERQLTIVFGNGAGLATYATGDSLLLDDVSIYYEFF